MRTWKVMSSARAGATKSTAVSNEQTRRMVRGDFRIGMMALSLNRRQVLHTTSIIPHSGPLAGGIGGLVLQGQRLSLWGHLQVSNPTQMYLPIFILFCLNGLLVVGLTQLAAHSLQMGLGATSVSPHGRKFGTMQNKLNQLALLLTLLTALLVMAGCSQEDDVTSPAVQDEDLLLAEDPIEDALKAMDGEAPADHNDRLARIAELLELDEEQLVAFTEAYDAHHAAMQDLRAQVQADEITLEEARELAAGLREEFEAELQIILTEEQWDLLQEMREHGRRPHRPRPGHGPGNYEERWTYWLGEVGADETQIAAVLEAKETEREALQDIRIQCRAGDITREEARAASEMVRADFDAALQTILTVEQYEDLLAMLPDRPRPPAGE
jgi:hypothetical protein